MAKDMIPRGDGRKPKTSMGEAVLDLVVAATSGSVSYVSTQAAMLALSAKVRITVARVEALQRRKRARAAQATRVHGLLERAGVSGEGLARAQETADAMAAHAQACDELAAELAGVARDAQAVQQTHQAEYGPIKETVDAMGVTQARAGFYETN